jgi:hypothetical protein
MLHTIYVIHQLSGVCMVFRQYGTISFNEDLIAGFLIALKDFSQEVTGGAGTIKVMDMVVFNIHLFFGSGILVAAGSDKYDDRGLVQNCLEAILTRFVATYGSEGNNRLEDWMGDLNDFRDFGSFLDEASQMGKVAEVPIQIPMLKIFKKGYQQELKRIKKGIDLDAQNAGDINLKAGWNLFDWRKADNLNWKAKRLPRNIVDAGYISAEEFEIAHRCDGFNDIEEIARQSNTTQDRVLGVLENLKKLDMLDWIQR